MTSELISKKARTELREYFVGTSLREIETEFDSADVPVDLSFTPQVSGQRRALVEQYYHTVNWDKWADVRKIITVYENVLINLENQAERGLDWATATFNSLKKWIERDGFGYDNGKLIPRGKHHGLGPMAEAVDGLDLPELHRQIGRMQSAIEDDPALAIGTAKELVESVCKTILQQRNIDFQEDADIGHLMKSVRNALGLVPEAIPNAAKGSEVIRRLLSNMGNITQGLAELRNLYGTGHGRGGAAKGMAPRHARLAVGAAATLATFLFETHNERGF